MGTLSRPRVIGGRRSRFPRGGHIFLKRNQRYSCAAKCYRSWHHGIGVRHRGPTPMRGSRVESVYDMSACMCGLVLLFLFWFSELKFPFASYCHLQKVSVFSHTEGPCL